VALQGTIETFALPDVLRLLASTKKTGRLRLTSSQGSGSIWLADGEIVSSEATHAPMADGADEVVFELLRFKVGEFVFDADASAPEGGAPAAVEDALTAAESMLAEWKSIEAVVPSLAGWVSLAPELPGSEITIDQSRWAQVVAIGGGITVGGLGDRLGLGELSASRTVKELIELGLTSLGDAPEGAPGFVDTFEPVAVEPADAAPEAPFLSVVDDPPTDSGSFDPGALVIEPPSFGASLTESTPTSTPAEPVDGTDDDDLTDAAEIARQLANLSPKAARAVAAAAKATTEEEREAALAEVDDDEEPINRGLLLKFLGSVNG
jgi:hypothetical protein